MPLSVDALYALVESEREVAVFVILAPLTSGIYLDFRFGEGGGGLIVDR